MRRFNVLVGAIPVRQQELLLLRRSDEETFLPGTWGLPCGKIDFGEKLEDAVLRELREEAGLDGKIRAMAGYSMFISRRGSEDLHNVQINFVVEVDGTAVDLDGSSSKNHKWVSLEDVENAGLDSFTVQAILGAADALRDQ